MLKQIVFLALASLLAQGAWAQSEGDPERGKTIAYTCFGCHGIPYQMNIYPTYPVPKIGGQTEGYIISALKSYRAGERPHGTMIAQGNTLSDQDIYDIAAYFVSIHEGDES